MEYAIAMRPFDNQMMINICQISLSPSVTKHNYIWVRNKSGIHSIKSFYLGDQDKRFSRGNESFWSRVWGLKVHEGLELQLWRTANGSLPWVVVDDLECTLCDFGPDGFKHLFG